VKDEGDVAFVEGVVVVAVSRTNDGPSGSEFWESKSYLFDEGCLEGDDPLGREAVRKSFSHGANGKGG
jgi:hypothetical protein